jgi:hypothetical protein
MLPPFTRKLRIFPRRTVHVWAREPVDLSTFVGSEETREVINAMTCAILDAITRLLEEIRGEAAPPRTAEIRYPFNPA